MMNFFNDSKSSPSTSPSGDGGGMAMFNFFNEPADESESGQNGDGQDGAGFLATLFGKGGSEEENDTQQTTNVGLFNSTFFDDVEGDKSVNEDGPEDLPFFMSPPPAAKKKSDQQKQPQENAKKSNSKASAAAKQDAEPSRHGKSQPHQGSAKSNSRDKQTPGKVMRSEPPVVSESTPEKKFSNGVELETPPLNKPQSVRKRHHKEQRHVTVDIAGGKKIRESPDLMPPPPPSRKWVHPMQKINEHSPTGPEVDITSIPLKPSKEKQVPRVSQQPKQPTVKLNGEEKIEARFLAQKELIQSKQKSTAASTGMNVDKMIFNRPDNESKCTKEPMDIREKLIALDKDSSLDISRDEEIISGLSVKPINKESGLMRFEALLREEQQDHEEPQKFNTSRHPAMDATFNNTEIESTFNISAADSSHNDSGTTAAAEEFASALMSPEYAQLREHLSSLPAAKASGNFVFQVAASVDALFKCTETVVENELVTLSDTQSGFMSSITMINEVLRSQIEECNAMHQAQIEQKLNYLSSILDEIKTNQQELDKYKNLLRALSMDLNEQ